MQRYEFHSERGQYESSYWMQEADDGDYVLYADAKAIEEENDRLKAIIRAATTDNDRLNNQVGGLLSDLCDEKNRYYAALEEINRLKAERRQDALDGQAALDEASNEIVRLRAELAVLAYLALFHGIISRGRFAELLHIDRADVDDKMAELAEARKVIALENRP